jgi:hypothetical protein
MSEQSIIEQMQYVELNRRFRKLEEDAKSEDAALASYTAGFFGMDSSLGWDDLLKEFRVIILGEPGSGKTWELREQVKIIDARGGFAFFIRLDQLVHHDLSALFCGEEQRLFAQWKQSDVCAYFFLDSVDEAKFRNLSNFYSTLERFANELGGALLARSKIFLSSRISEWKPASDAFEIRRLFPLPPTMVRDDGDGKSKTAKHETPVPLVVHIQALDQVQVECLARANSMQNISAFVQELDRAFAWEFARRPLDVLALIAFWKSSGRIGSWTELIEFDVATKLRPRTNRDEHPLSEAEAFVGATWLAASNLFCRKFSFFVADNVSTDAEALNPTACLPCDWRDDQTRALLNRAIFDSAIYGRFRFHHRRIAEFLAAKWLTARMENGCPQNELKRLLVEDVRGRKVFRPAMRSVAAWLCRGSNRWNQMVRNLVVEIDPEIHLNFGDATGLAVDYRRQVLRTLAERSKQRRRTWLQTSHDCLARFADSSLAVAIKALILDRTLAVDFRIEMLEIVRCGRLTEALDAAIQLVSDTEEPDELKQYAVLAIAAVDSPAIRKQLAHVTSQLSRIPNRLCSATVQALFPDYISPVELATLLAKSEPVREFSLDLPYHLKAHFESSVLPGSAGALLKELITLAQRHPYTIYGHETIPVSEQFYWIGQLVPTILAKLFEKPALSSSEIDVAAEALQLLGHIRECHHHEYSSDETGTLNDLSLKQPRVRQQYFWRLASAYRALSKKEPTMSLELIDCWEVLRLSTDDFQWLLSDAIQRSDADDRLLALRFAIESWDGAGRPLSLRWHLRATAKHEPALWAAYRQSVLTQLFFPLKRFWYHKIRYNYGRWWWIRKVHQVQVQWRRLRERITLLRKIKLIESGKPVKWLERLSREADQTNTSHWAMSSWTDLEKKRGKRIARAVKRGCTTVWRGYTPPLPHEKPKPNVTSIELIVGITGLQVEFDENPNAISKLSQAEAVLATRYAMDELNGFPTWIEDLAKKHPEAVRQVLRQCVQAEWRFAADCKDVHETMAKLSWRGDMLVNLIRNDIQSLLAGGDPENYSILRAALTILTSMETPPLELLAKLAAQRAPAASNLTVKVLWLSVWMQTDGQAAVKYLEMILKEVPNSDEIMIHLCSVLSGGRMERNPSIKLSSYLQTTCLRRFIPLVYTHVRLSDDLDRSGQTYSPTARDDAQQFRNVLLDNLAKSDAPSATNCLCELADEPAMSQSRDWILNLVDERLKRQSDFVPWTPSDLRAFAQNHEVDPKSDRELFAIAHKRICELKFDVESSNNSLRDELPRDAKEIDLRRWLARKLEERSRNRYNIPQEPEIDFRQRPDLQFLRPGLPPVPVEAKLADLGWSVSVLIERLENQLVGRYLRDHKTDYGIYVIGTLGGQKHWEHPQDGRKLTFAEVVAVLSDRANELVKTTPRIGNLAVIGIDFSESKRG